MLKNIPFYASLLGRPLPNEKVSTNSHVLVYGAIEAHSFGPKGCIASNRTIAKETGLKENSVQTIISILAKAGWVNVTLDKNNHRKQIEPIMVIMPPLLSPSYIDNSNIRNKDTETKVSEPPKEKEDKVSKLFWMVIKKYGLPVVNANNIRKWIGELKKSPDSEKYLTTLLDWDLRDAEGEFRPTLNSAFDILNKKIKIQRFYNGGEDKKELDPRVFGSL